MRKYIYTGNLQHDYEKYLGQEGLFGIMFGHKLTKVQKQKTEYIKKSLMKQMAEPNRKDRKEFFSKQLVFPKSFDKFMSFTDFFEKDKTRIWDKEDIHRIAFLSDKRICIGNYLIITDLRNGGTCQPSLFSVATELLVKVVDANMIKVENDSIYFEIIIYDNKEAMLIAKYNQIIGNKWIAMIKTDTIPFILSNL